MSIIYTINLNTVDYDYLFQKLQNIGYKQLYMGEMSFCPHLIVLKDPEDSKSYVYENVNDGFLRAIKKNHEVIEDTDINTFISHAINLKSGTYVNALF